MVMHERWLNVLSFLDKLMRKCRKIEYEGKQGNEEKLKIEQIMEKTSKRKDIKTGNEDFYGGNKKLNSFCFRRVKSGSFL